MCFRRRNNAGSGALEAFTRFHAVSSVCSSSIVTLCTFVALLLFLGGTTTASAQQVSKREIKEMGVEEYKRKVAAGLIEGPDTTVNRRVISPKRALSLTATQSTSSGLRVPLDSSFSVVQFDGPGGSGEASPDDSLQRNDDDVTDAIPIGFDFDFYGTTYDSIYVNNNGNITLENPKASFDPVGFPAEGFKMVAPFWADVDTRNDSSGVVYRRIDSNQIIVTWNGVGYYSQNVDKLNTFQVIISNGEGADVPDGKTVCFSYADMQWTTGSASGGENGFGGAPATAGVNKGDGSTFALIGRFDKDGTSYDGPGGNPDGVDYLDGQQACFDTGSGSDNLPPAAQNLPDSPVTIAAGDTTSGSFGFLSPEDGQVTTVSVSGQPSNFEVTTSQGNPASVEYSFAPSSEQSGQSFTVTFTATDDGDPAQSTTVDLTFTVGEIIPTPSNLTATSGVGSIDLSWNAVNASTLAGYNLYRSTSSFSDTSSATKINSALLSDTSYTDEAVTPGTTYFYRVTAVDSESNESNLSSQASAQPAGPPAAQTEPATDVTPTEAVLNGTVDPNTNETTVEFEYFPTGNEGQAQTVTAAESPLSGDGSQSVSAAISGLDPGTEYTFRVRAQNSAGSDTGSDRTFMTSAAPPVAQTNSATNVAATGAQFNGMVNPNGAEATVKFEYYPAGQPGQLRSVTAAESPLTGIEAQAVSARVEDLRPETEYMARVVASNEEGTDRGSVTSFTTPALEAAFQPPSESPGQGSESTVRITIPEGFTPSEIARLFYRPVGVQDFQSTPLEAVDQTTYRGTIPGTALTERGIEYYARLSNGTVTVTLPESNPTSQPRYLPVRTSEMRAGVELDSSEYSMISAPLRLDTTDALAQLGDDFGRIDRTEWRLLRWNSETEEYDEVTAEGETGDLTPGRAYWLITRDGMTQGGEETFDVGPGRSVQAAPIQLELPPGWTQFANPRPYPIAWSAVEGHGSVMAPVAYDPAATDSSDFNVEILGPWKGYWVFNPNGSAIQVSVPSPEAGSGTSQGAGTTMKGPSFRSGEEGEPLFGGASMFDTRPIYAVRLTARLEREEAPDLRDHQNVVGVAEGGRPGVQAEDVADPPPISDYLRLSVVEQTPGGRSVRLAGSLRPPSEKGQTWDLEVSASGAGSKPHMVHGRLQARGALPPSFKRRLMDRDTGRPIPIENDGTFTLQLTGERPVRHLRLIVGTEDFAEAQSENIEPERTGLRAVYPNPSRGPVSVDYHLKKAQRVEVQVFDLLGRNVRTLVAGQREAGHHTVRWSGSRVASGTYIVRLKTETTSATQRVSVIR